MTEYNVPNYGFGSASVVYDTGANASLASRFVVDSYGKVRQVSPGEAEGILNDGGREATDPEIRAWYTGRKQTPPL